MHTEGSGGVFGLAETRTFRQAQCFQGRGGVKERRCLDFEMEGEAELSREVIGMGRR